MSEPTRWNAQGRPLPEPADRVRTTGKVKWFNTQKGPGFITRDDGQEDVFAHRRQLAPDPAGGGRYLDRGDRVEFDVVLRGSNPRPQAENVVKLVQQETR